MAPPNVTLLLNIAGPVTYNDEPTPNPPATYNAFCDTELVLANVPKTVNVLPTYKSLPIPTPPTTVNAPEVVEVALVELVMVVAFLIIVEPVAAPMVIAVADPAKLTVVAVVSTKLKVTAVVSMSPPLTNKSPATVSLPPTYKLLPIPTPPTTCNAPELVDNELIIPVKVKVLL